MMAELATLNCASLRGKAKETERLLEDAQIEAYLQQVPEWQIVNEAGMQRLRRVFRFKDFAEAMAFTNRVGEIAEQQDHHPALLTEWGKVTVTYWSHVLHGLHLNDFIMAAKTNEFYERD